MQALLFTLLTAGTASAQDHHGKVSALGRLQPQYGIIRVGVASLPEAISGSLVARLFVNEGDDVEAGALLASTDSSQVLQARLEEAAAEVKLAQESYQAAQSQADEACVRADVSAREAQRRARLLDRKLASEEETEAAEGQARANAASCTAARADTQVADARIDVATRALAVARAEFERSQIRAPAAGRILRILARPGEFVATGGVLEFGRVDKMYAVAEVFENDIRRVRVGQTATVSSPALEHPLRGKVDIIHQKVQKLDVTGTDPAAVKDARIVEVEILLDEPKLARKLTNLQVEIVIDA
jgi:HlyD family secretion protein